MSSLDHDFNELIERVKHGREFGHASSSQFSTWSFTQSRSWT